MVNQLSIEYGDGTMEHSCTVCKEVKSVGEFYKSKRYSTGIRQPCKECVKCQGESYRSKVCVSEIPDHKECNNCKITKPNKDFNNRSDTPTGLRSECKSCESVKRHNHYVENKEWVLEQTNQYRLDHKEDYARWKRERRSKDLEGHLEKEREYREVKGSL